MNTTNNRIEQFGKLVDRIANWLHKTELEEIRKSDISNLTYSELHILKEIENIDNAKTFEIADKVGVSRPSMTATIDKLQKKDFVYRDKDPNDRRAVIIRLTKKGLSVNEQHEKLHHKVAEALLSDLSESQQDLVIKAFENILN